MFWRTTSSCSKNKVWAEKSDCEWLSISFNFFDGYIISFSRKTVMYAIGTGALENPWSFDKSLRPNFGISCSPNQIHKHGLNFALSSWWCLEMHECVCMCVRACVHACVHACVRVCVCARMHVHDVCVCWFYYAFILIKWVKLYSIYLLMYFLLLVKGRQLNFLFTD